MPSKSTVLRWLKVHPEFQEALPLRVKLQADLMVEEILEIADDASQDSTKTIRSLRGYWPLPLVRFCSTY
jgi:dihydroorotate dehydrogenase